MPAPRQIHVRIRVDGPDFAEFRAYCEANNVPATVAARELLLTSTAQNATNAVFLANAKRIRRMMMQIAVQSVAKVAGVMMEELHAQMLANGISIDEVQL